MARQGLVRPKGCSCGETAEVVPTRDGSHVLTSLPCGDEGAAIYSIQAYRYR
jgi:hypothetical protein